MIVVVNRVMARVRAHLIISGRVQGVFFRFYTREEAVKRGLAGWVKNLPSGDVEVEFEGEKEVVDDMIKWCKKGPSSANVTNTEIKWQDFQRKEEGFRIR